MQNNTRPSVLRLNFTLGSWLKLRLKNISEGQDLILGPYRNQASYTQFHRVWSARIVCMCDTKWESEPRKRAES